MRHCRRAVVARTAASSCAAANPFNPCRCPSSGCGDSSRCGDWVVSESRPPCCVRRSANTRTGGADAGRLSLTHALVGAKSMCVIKVLIPIAEAGRICFLTPPLLAELLVLGKSTSFCIPANDRLSESPKEPSSERTPSEREHVCTLIYLSTYIHTCIIHTYTHASIHTYTPTYIHIHPSIHTYIHTHTCIHIHM
jgi:hypothetical protein